MAGIGIRLNKIFNKNLITTSLYGIGCSISYTIAPMFLVMGTLLAMYQVLGFNNVGYSERELFSCTVLYIFIFSLLLSAPLNSVLSKYLADVIYQEKLEDVRPCVFLGLLMILGVCGITGAVFYLREYIVGKVAGYYVFTSYLCYLALAFVFSMMIFTSVLKIYKKITMFFIYGMASTIVTSLIFRFILSFDVTYSMLLGLTVGFIVIGICQSQQVLSTFRLNSYSYKPALEYPRKYWKLIVSNACYAFGLFSHNFVFWKHPWNMTVVNSYVCNQPYDMATCLAMFTNISATTFFIVRTEMRFRDKYALFIHSVIGSKLDTIETNKHRMTQVLSEQLLSLVRLQFCVSVVLFLVFKVVSPKLGVSSLTMSIYPMMSAAYFVVFIFYSNLLFLYYFNDLNGATFSSVIFLSVTIIFSFVAKLLSPEWYGIGLFMGSFTAYAYSYFRLRWVEKHMLEFIYCRGSILGTKIEKMPSNLVYPAENNNHSN